MTEAQMRCLRWLERNGGIAWLDGYGRLVAQGECHKIGSEKSWMFLIALGFISGGDRRLKITEKGIAALTPNAPVQARGEAPSPGTGCYTADGEKP